MDFSSHQKPAWYDRALLLGLFMRVICIKGIMLLRVRGGGEGFEELGSPRTLKEDYCMAMSGNAGLEVPFGAKRPIFNPGIIKSEVRAGEGANSHIGVSSSHIWTMYLAVSTLRCSNPCRCIHDFAFFLLSEE